MHYPVQSVYKALHSAFLLTGNVVASIPSLSPTASKALVEKIYTYIYLVRAEITPTSLEHSVQLSRVIIAMRSGTNLSCVVSEARQQNK